MIELIQGDCLEVMKSIPDGSIDLTVTSPPYDNLRTYNGNIAQWSFDKFKGIAEQLFRVTKQGGVVVWVVADATINGSETGTSFKQALWFMECGFKLNDTMIWEKPGFTATGALVRRYAQVFEYMFVLSKGNAVSFNPIKDKPNKNCGKKLNGNLRQPDGSMRPVSGAGKLYKEYGQRYNVWHIDNCNKSKERLHPAPFPEQLAMDHIVSWSNPGDTVLDPFMGSGTTGKMATLNDRNFIGIELDEGYFEIAKKRIGDSDANY